MCIRDRVLKRGRLNTVGKTEDGKEFHRTDVAGKKEAPQRTSLGFSMLTQNACESMAPLVLRGRAMEVECEWPTLLSIYRCSTYRKEIVRQRHVAEIEGQESLKVGDSLLVSFRPVSYTHLRAHET